MIYRVLKKRAQQTLLLVLTIYGDYLSYFFPSSCRFYPSCSHYSRDAIKEHGVIRGLYMTLGRLLRCHPWHEGGFDPVPKNLTVQPCCSQQHRLKIDSPTNI